MAIVDTTSQAYITRLTFLTDLWDDYKALYGPVVKRMNRAQLQELRQRDPLFAKFIEIGQSVGKLADRAGFEI